MKKKSLSRKDFLKYSGKTLAAAALTNGPLSILFDSVLKSSLNRAYAEGGRPRKWVDMRFDLSPPRFVYDLFLMNKAADKTTFVHHDKHMFTKFVATGGRYTSGVYEAVEMMALGKSTREIHAPYLWSQNVPAAGGGVRPMADLLPYFLNIRGIDTGNPGHVGSQQLHFLPLGASQSLSALSGDGGSPAPIAALNYNAGNFQLKSIKANSPTLLSGTNLITSLLTPFNPTFAVTTARTREEQVKTYLETARAGLKADAIARHQDADAVHKAIAGARDLLGGTFGDLNVAWSALFDKYTDLINRALTTVIPGINDKPVGIPAAQRKPGTVQGGGAYDLIGVPILNEDLCTIFEGATIRDMAASFAIAEFTLLNDLSDSVTVRIGEFTNLNMVTTLGGTPTRMFSTFDEHTTGGMLSTLINTMHAVAHSACLLELIDRLKAAGQWQNTVINCSGEFNRVPRANGTGSDHSYFGASLALYSGIIDGPHVLGDIAKATRLPSYKGSFGEAVVQSGAALDNAKMDIGNAAATVAQLLGVRSPITAREPVLYVRGNSIYPRLPPGKIVTGI